MDNLSCLIKLTSDVGALYTFVNGPRGPPLHKTGPNSSPTDIIDLYDMAKWIVTVLLHGTRTLFSK